MEALEQDVDHLDSCAWSERRGRLERIEEAAEALPHSRELDRDGLLRVDAASGLRVSLPRSLVPELERFLGWYARLCAGLYPRSGLLQAYARRFLSHFPANRDIDALDLYHGVFEDGEDTRPVAFPAPAGSGSSSPEQDQTFRRVRDLMANAALAAQADGRDEVSLEALDWEAVLGSSRSPAYSCGVLFQVEATDLEAIRAGRYHLALNALYPGGGLASARLAHLHAGEHAVEDGPLARELKSSWKWLEKGGATVAEVSFMHSTRTANAVLRPSLFRHEIELPGDRATPGREVIPLGEDRQGHV